MVYAELDVTLLWAAPAFIAGVLLFSVLMSVLGGWYGLAKKYPVPDEIGSVIGIHRWGSLAISYMTGYRSVISFTITNKGILIRPSVFLMVLHKPMFLPWKEITSVEYGGRLLKRIIIRIRGIRLVTSGKAAKTIFTVYNEQVRKTA